MSEPLFTAGDLTAALGVTSRSIRRMLAATPSDGERLLRGQLTKAWRIESLPSETRKRLEALRQAKGCAAVRDLVAARGERYFPTGRRGTPLPLSEIEQSKIDGAGLLQKALAIVLRNPEWRGEELVNAGLREHKRVFGYEVSERHWSRLFRRTIERDGGLLEWDRIELYLPDGLQRAATPAGAQDSFTLGLLDEALGNVERHSKASTSERNLVWLKACDQLGALIEEGHEEKRAKRQIVRRLQRSGCVGTDKAALKRLLNMKWRAFVTDGSPSIFDRRAEANQRRRRELPEMDRKTILAASVDCEARVSQGYREALLTGRLTSETTQRFISNPSRKSYVPATVRREIAQDARKAVEARRRPRHVELNGAYHPRDYSGFFAGDSFCADDSTNPLYFWQPDENSRHGWSVLRGQFLPMVDERSWLVLTFALHAEPNYNSRVIRGLITATHDQWGLPRRRFRFEMGIWKTSRILKGGGGEDIGLDHAEMGLREFGVSFSHAKLARGKMVESVLAALQNRMEGLPGYSSRNEMVNKNETLAKQLLEIERGVHPRKYLMSREEWIAALSKLISEYNNAPQEGKCLEGRSPLQCWNETQHPTEPMTHLGVEARYLLASHRLTLKIGSKGVKLRPSLGGGLYADASTGRLAGRRMLVWVNPDQLDHIAITDIARREKPVFVPLVPPVPVLNGGKEYRAGKAQVDAHNNYGRTVYRSIQPHLADHSFRALAVDRSTVKVGEDMQEGIVRFQAEKKKKAAVSRRIGELSRKLGGVRPTVTSQNAESVAQGLEMLDEAKRMHEEASNDL